MITKEDQLYFRGRVALAEILKSANIGENDLVAIQAYTCSAVPEGVFSVKAKPLYIDVVEEGVTMCPDDLEVKLKSTLGVKALVIQHTFGVVADMGKILQIAQRNSLIVIEDCCHSFNSEFDGKKVGSFSDASFYSFEWGKPVSLGLGGAARVKNEEMLAEIKRSYTLLFDPSISTELQLALQRFAFLLFYSPRTYWIVKKLYHFFSQHGLIKGNHSSSGLENRSKDFDLKISKIIKKKVFKKIDKLPISEIESQNLVSIYESDILCLPGVKKIHLRPLSKVIYVRYPLWLKDKNRVCKLAAENKVELATWYESPVHPFGLNELSSVGYKVGSCPNAEKSCKHVVSLPLSHHVNDVFINKLKEIIV